MSFVRDYSHANVWNSIAVLLTRQCLAEGYCIYWHEIDGVETADGFYGNYSATQTSLLADPTFSGRIAAAKGLLTVRGPLTANPRFVTRPTVSGAVADQDDVPIPALAIEIGDAVPIENYELGAADRATNTGSLKWRSRTLLIQFLGRSEPEQRLFRDRFAEWFDLDVEVNVADHDGGTLAVLGTARVDRPSVEGNIVVRGPEATTYAVELNARLEYVA